MTTKCRLFNCMFFDDCSHDQIVNKGEVQCYRIRKEPIEELELTVDMPIIGAPTDTVFDTRETPIIKHGDLRRKNSGR